MDWFNDFINSVRSLEMPPALNDILDIAVLAFVILKLIQFMRDTRTGSIVKGVIILLVVYMFAYTVNMKVTLYLLGKIFNIGVLALIVLFQPELRRSIEKVGYFGWGMLSKLGGENGDVGAWTRAIDVISETCENLSATTTGALIVIERETKLGELVETGVVLNAEPSRELLGTIFFPKTPLHDGAVIMRDGMVYAAACFLPKPENEKMLPSELGSRHRAAIGMSENSDAVVIVVSEETGGISIAENGELVRGFSKDTLKKALRDKILSDKLKMKLKRPEKRSSQNNG
ncbi:MAG: diadenylate cyclase CdaA [Oscillospiraceae bacterium]|nr:diadenylate cyclase CdaA [Oscillospiraceae bacterium]MBQ8978562.1 diadenylate cyclase CdaA [Oscillospiraceae bacterium]